MLGGKDSQIKSEGERRKTTRTPEQADRDTPNGRADHPRKIELDRVQCNALFQLFWLHEISNKGLPGRETYRTKRAINKRHGDNLPDCNDMQGSKDAQ